MVDTKPVTLWAVVSLVFSILGCLASLALLAFLEHYRETARGTAGLGYIFMGMHMMLAAALCLPGILFGTVALVRIRNGQFGGRGQAWTGIVLGCFPFVIAAVAFLTSSADSNPLRW